MITLRLVATSYSVDVRLREINGRWIASADTPDGASLGIGLDSREAVEQALASLDDVADELLASLPRE